MQASRGRDAVYQRKASSLPEEEKQYTRGRHSLYHRRKEESTSARQDFCQRKTSNIPEKEIGVYHSKTWTPQQDER